MPTGENHWITYSFTYARRKIITFNILPMPASINKILAPDIFEAGRHTVELRHFLNMPDVYYVCRCKIVIRHLTKRLSSLDVDRYSVAYPRTLIIEGCHIEPSGRCWISATW